MRTILNFFSAVGFVILTGLMAVSGNSLASTPDGMTPSEETVCDVLKTDGVTKGLYGLCVAYCEAQDNDQIDKTPANPKILANYRRKMSDTDPDMPCVHVPCPCWTQEELDTATMDDSVAIVTATSCIRSPLSSVVTLNVNLSLISDNAPGVRIFDADIATNGTKCSHIDTTQFPPVNSQLISPDEADACFSALNTACDNFGL